MPTDISIGLDRFDLREILLRGSDTWNQWRKENPAAFIDLFGINLLGADLREADLREANLRGANLRGAILSGAILSGANLHEATLLGATLFGVTLHEAILSGVNFRRADLRESDLHGAVLRGAILSRADLSGAKLFGANLRGATLFRVNLHDADLRRADLRQVNLRGATLHKANLRGANLYEADLCGANLHEANLRGVNLHKADIRGANLLIEETFSIKVFDQEMAPNALDVLKNAIANYADAAGYIDPEIVSEEHGSFFSKIRYKIAEILTPESIEEVTQAGEEIYRCAKENIREKLEGTGRESAQKLANAMAEILKAVELFDKIVLILGKLIVVKHPTPDSKTKTIIRTVSTEIYNKLESKPHILDDLNTLLAFLQGETTVA